jgi:23S rRNA pseudouridine1911/1915/1917 synthase
MNQCEKEEFEEIYLEVSQGSVGLRLDKFLSQTFPEQSRTYFQFLIEEDAVWLNKLLAKKRTLLKIGDEVVVRFLPSQELKLEAENIPLDILYEDEELLVINKPAGLVVHPGAGNWSNTLVNGLLYHCKNLQQAVADPFSLRPGIIHRLDKDTTGLIVAAKTERAQKNLATQFSERTVKKYYLAICVGNPGSGKVEAPIARHPILRQQMAVVEGGKYALTTYETIGSREGFSLVRVGLETGRTHQIRVHMRHIGTPILGDPLYGFAHVNKKQGLTRQLLHAWQLVLAHPITGASMALQAPLPADMEAEMQRLGMLLGTQNNAKNAKTNC